VQLLVAELCEQTDRPGDVFGRDVLEQLAMPSMVIELHDPVLDTPDEAIPFEGRDIVAIADRPFAASKRCPEVLHDVPAPRFGGGIIDHINPVLAGLEIPVVDEQVGDDQPFELPRSHVRPGMPRPVTVSFVPFLQSQPRGAAVVRRLAPVEFELLHEVGCRLVKANRPQQS
jgi:hypothetical protein